MRCYVLVVSLAIVLSIQVIRASDNESTTLPSKYASRLWYTVPTTTTTTAASEIDEESTTLTPSTTTPRTTPKKRKFFGRTRITTYSTTSTTEAPTTTPSTLATTTTTESPEIFESNITTTTSAPEPVVDCGKRDPESTVHPWIVILEHSDPLNSTRRRTFSKGVLVSDRFVLTTVSSIHNSYPFWEVTRVRLGDFPVGLYRKLSSYHPVFVDVEEIVMHPKRDIALIKLKEPVKFNELIQPICLPISDNYKFRELILHRCQKLSHFTPKRVKVDGVSVMPISPQDCSTLFHRKGADFVAREEFCSWDERKDTCTGDLGGPLIGKHNGRFHVIGLSSFATSKTLIQDDTLPGIYTRVGNHLNWINKVLRDKVDEGNQIEDVKKLIEADEM